MRIIHLSCAVLLAACTAGSRAPAAESEPGRVVQAFYDALNRRDVEGVLAAYAPDAVLVEPASAEFPADTMVRGTGELRRHYKQLFTIIPDTRVELRERRVDGRTVEDELVVHGHPCKVPMTGTVRYEVVDGRIRSMMELPPDEEVEMEVVSIVPGVHVSCPATPAP